MSKTFFTQYAGIPHRAILTMVPTADLLRLGNHYYERSASNLEERQAILIELFSRYKNEIDIYYQIKYIQHSDLDLFTTTLSNRSFILSLNNALRSPFSNIAHKLAIVSAWNGTHAKISSFELNLRRKINKQIQTNNEIQYEIQQDLQYTHARKYTSKYLYSMMEGYVRNFIRGVEHSQQPGALRLKALLTHVNNETIKLFKDDLLKKIFESPNNPPLSPHDLDVDKRRKICSLDIISPYLDTNDIELLIQFACKKLIDNSYMQLEIFTHLWPRLSDSAKKPFINDLLEKINDSYSNINDITEALQIACIPNLIKHKSDFDLFSTPILGHINSENNSLRSAAFFAAMTFSLEINTSTFSDSIERALNSIEQELNSGVDSFEDSKSLKNIQNILPKLKKNELDIVVLNFIEKIKNCNVLTFNKEYLIDYYTDILSNYIISHQVSSVFEQALNSSEAPKEIKLLKHLMNQWQLIQTKTSERTLQQTDFEEISNKDFRKI